MGKNYSGNTGRVNGTRKDSDAYPTPYSLTRLLLQKESFFSPIYEPACGDDKAIVKVLEENGYNTEFSDLLYGDDFLQASDRNPVASLVTNPPYSLAFEFIQKAKQIAKRQIAMLLPLSYLHGQQRYEQIWQDTVFPLARIWVFTRYPMLGDALREDGKVRTGMQVYAWMIWEKGHVGPATLGWLDLQPYILGKKDSKEGTK